MKKRRWIPADDRALRRLWTGNSARAIGAVIGRTAHAIKNRVRDLKLGRKNRKWSDAEDKIIRARYAIDGREKTARKLKGRSPSAVGARAGALGIRKVIENLWTDEQRQMLRERYFDTPIDKLCKMVGHPRLSVRTRAVQDGLSHRSRSTESRAEASERLGVDDDTLRRALVLAGEKLPRGREFYLRLPPDRFDAALKLFRKAS